jgi:hypothetical protein
MEDAAWSIAHTWKNAADVQFVQANEAPLEGQTWLHSPEVKS